MNEKKFIQLNKILTLPTPPPPLAHQKSISGKGKTHSHIVHWLWQPPENSKEFRVVIEFFPLSFDWTPILGPIFENKSTIDLKSVQMKSIYTNTLLQKRKYTKHVITYWMQKAFFASPIPEPAKYQKSYHFYWLIWPY